MARFYSSALKITLKDGAAGLAKSAALLAVALLLTGCAQEQMVANLPSPNLNGPVVTHQVMMPPQPRIVQPPAAPAPHESLAGIPHDWIAPVPPRHWVYIVIHHSATPSGGAVRFDREHKEKGWDELGYHFVIGNGTDTSDGQVEVGPRWFKQKWGAHAKTPDNRYNDYGIGICLVGNFEVQHPSAAQLRSAAKLVAYLIRTYHINPENIVRHGDTKQTACPGRNVNVPQIVSMAHGMLADAGDEVPLAQAWQSMPVPDGAELLIDGQ